MPMAIFIVIMHWSCYSGHWLLISEQNLKNTVINSADFVYVDFHEVCCRETLQFMIRVRWYHRFKAIAEIADTALVFNTSVYVILKL
jgi:hypothetical protein